MAKGSEFETLLIGGGVLAGGALLWANRAKLGLGAHAAAGGGTTLDPTTLIPTSSLIANPPAGAPLLTAPIQLPTPVSTTLPQNIVQVQPTLTVAPITQTAGCVVGAGGGLYCPDTPGAQVLAAQTDACLPPSSQEIAVCQTRKPTWSQATCTTRLTQLRSAYCAGKQALATANGNTTVIENWTSAMQGNRTDYLNLTGVLLT